MSHAHSTGTSGSTGQGWHYEQVKAAVRMRGSSFAELSRQHGYAVGTIAVAVQRAGTSSHAERIVAEFLGMRLHDIWPERYDTQDAPLHATRGARKSRLALAEKQHKRRAIKGTR